MPVSGTVRQVFLRWVSAGSSLRAAIRMVASGTVARRVAAGVRAAVSATAAPRATIEPGAEALRAGATIVAYPRQAKPVVAAIAMRVAVSASADRTLIVAGRLAPKVAIVTSPITARSGSGVATAKVAAFASPRAAVAPGVTSSTLRVKIAAAPDRRSIIGAALKPAVRLSITPGQVVGRFGGTSALRAKTSITADSAVSSLRITSAGDVRVTSTGDRRIRWEKA